jgi:hypothetical protein
MLFSILATTKKCVSESPFPDSDWNKLVQSRHDGNWQREGCIIINRLDKNEHCSAQSPSVPSRWRIFHDDGSFAMIPQKQGVTWKAQFKHCNVRTARMRINLHWKARCLFKNRGCSKSLPLALEDLRSNRISFLVSSEPREPHLDLATGRAEHCALIPHLVLSPTTGRVLTKRSMFLSKRRAVAEFG